jgi:hypothetical protein
MSYFVDLEITSSGKVVDQRLGNERVSWPELFARRRPTVREEEVSATKLAT